MIKRLFQVKDAILYSLLFFFLTTQHVLADTYAGGAIRTNTTWTEANSPYIVVQNILVEEGVTLTINAGVTVKFDDGYGIDINGQLKVLGTSANQVLFTTSNTEASPGLWKGLTFSSTSIGATYNNTTYLNGSILQFCKIEYAGFAGTGVLVADGSSPYINMVSINNSPALRDFIIQFKNSNKVIVKELNLVGTHLPNSYDDGDGGILIDHTPNFSILNSKIENVSYGLTTRGYDSSYNISVTNCQFVDNTKIAIGNFTRDEIPPYNSLYEYLLSINYTLFTGCHEAVSAGSTSWHRQTTNIRNCTFTNNIYSLSLSKGNSSRKHTVNILNSTFIDNINIDPFSSYTINVAVNSGGWNFDEKFSLNIDNCEFNGNSHTYGASAIQIDGTISPNWSPENLYFIAIKNSKFINNYGEQSAVVIKNMIGSNFEGAFAYLPATCLLYIDNCEFNDNVGLGSGYNYHYNGISYGSALTIDFYELGSNSPSYDPFYAQINNSNFFSNKGCSTLSIRKKSNHLPSPKHIISNCNIINNYSPDDLSSCNIKNIEGKSSAITNFGFLTIEDTNIYNNTEYEIVNNSTNDVLAIGNYWEITNEPLISSIKPPALLV